MLGYAVPISDIAIEERPSRVAACVAGVYSATPSLRAWAADTVRAGVDDIHVYWTRLGHDSAAAMAEFSQTFDSTSSRRDVQYMRPFKPLKLPGVQYVEFTPAPLQWATLSKPMLYTVCVQRLRHSAAYVLVADPDEHLTLQAAQPQNVSALLDSIWPPDTASLNVHRATFPAECQERRPSRLSGDSTGKAGTASFSADEAVLMLADNNTPQPKYWVRPSRFRTAAIHTIAGQEADFKAMRDISPTKLYMKHIRAFDNDLSDPNRYCPPNLRGRLVNISDASQLHRLLSNTTLWPSSVYGQPFV